MNKGMQLVKNTLMYGVANFSSRLLNFLMLPLYTCYFSQKDFGYYDLILSFVQIATPFISLQMTDGMFRYLLDAEAWEKKADIIKSALAGLFRNALVSCVIFLLVLLIVPVRYGILILLYLFSYLALTVWQFIARGLKENVAFSLSGMISSVLVVAANMVMLLLLHMQIDALLISSILGAVAAVAYLEWKVKVFRMLSKGRIVKSLRKEITAFSLPLLPNTLNWWIINSSSRLLIFYFLGSAANGIFAVSSKFPSLLAMVNQIFYLAWQESAITEYNRSDRDEFYTKIFNLYAKLQLSSLLIALASTKMMMRLMVDSKFMDAWAYIPLLYLGMVFMSFSSFYGTGYLSAKSTKGAFYTSVYGAAVNLVLCGALIPLIGLMGASVASMAAFFVMWISRLAETRKYFSIRINLRAFAAIWAVVLLYLAGYYMHSVYVEIALFLASFVIAVFLNLELIRRVYAGLRKTRSRLSAGKGMNHGPAT